MMVYKEVKGIGLEPQFTGRGYAEFAAILAADLLNTLSVGSVLSAGLLLLAGNKVL